MKRSEYYKTLDMKYKWFNVSHNGGKCAVRARTSEEAIEIYAAYNMQLHVFPGTTAMEITDEQAESYYHKIR